MSSKNIKIFDETGCLSEDALVEYAHGRLGVHLKKQVEIHINECDFCRDALEGISLMKSKESSRAAIAQLNEKIANHGKPETAGDKVISMNYFRLAAAVALFFVLGGGILYVALNPFGDSNLAESKKEEQKVLAENKNEATETGLGAKKGDTVPSVLAPPAEPDAAGNVMQTRVDDSSGGIVMEKDANMETPASASDIVVTENSNANDIATMTATGGHSNVSANYYNPATFTSTGSAVTLTDSVYTFNADKYVTYDVDGAQDQKQLSEVTVVSASRTEKKSNDKKAQKEDNYKAARSEEKAKDEAKKSAADASGKAKEESEAKAKAETASAAERRADESADYALKVAEDKEEVEKARKNLEQQAATQSANGQTQQAEGDKVFAFSEQMPEYPGGVEALKKYITTNIQYPPAAKEKKVSGTVYISYVVDAAGNVTKVKVWRSVEAALDAEAVRVISSVKGYAPGKQGGKPVPVQMTIPVKFSLE